MSQYVFSSSSGSKTNVSCGQIVEAKRSIELLECILPSTFYKLRTGVNDSIDFKVGATTYACVIPAGAYTAGSICTATVAAMTAQTANAWAASFNSDTFKITISGTSAFNLLFGSGTNKANSVCALIGYTATDVTGAVTYTGTNAVQLGNPFSLYLRIAQVGSSVFCAGGQGYAFRLPVTCESGGICEIDVNSDYRQEIILQSTLSFNSLDMTLCYADGSSVDLNGSSYEIVLKVI